MIMSNGKKLNLTRERLDHILLVELGIRPDDEVIDFEIIERKRGDERFDRVRDEYRQNLKTHPNRHDVAKRLYVADDLIVYVRGRHPRVLFKGIHDENVRYYPFCSIDEIKRMQSLQNAEDYLLRLRADAIADNPRFIRIFLSRYNKKPAD